MSTTFRVAGPACLAVVLALAGCSAPDGGGRFSGETVIDATDGPQKRKIAHGRTLVVRLQGNVTTGYAWTCTANGAPVTEVVGEPEYVAGLAPRGKVGTGGTHVFRFRAAQKGQTELRFAYARSWEKDVPPVNTASVSVTVE